MWRFYLFYNRPEKCDFQFTWNDFKYRVNSELVGNLCNLVNRTFTFVRKYYDGIIPKIKEDIKEKDVIFSLRKMIENTKKSIEEHMENTELKDAFHDCFALSDAGNKAFQSGEPWKNIKENIDFASSLIGELCYLIKDVLIMIHPFMPSYADEAVSFLGKSIFSGRVFDGKCQKCVRGDSSLAWDDIGKREGLEKIENQHIIFKMLDEKVIEEYKAKFSGAKVSDEKDGAVKKGEKTQNESDSKAPPIDTFVQKIVLKTAKIVEVARHPHGDKLYILKVDDGAVKDRTILSGLVGFFTEEELLNKAIVIVDNLKPRKMRGIDSNGMLLAASCTKEDGSEVLELVSCPDVEVGKRLYLEGHEGAIKENITEEKKMINADTFFSVPFRSSSGVLEILGSPLLVEGKKINLKVVLNGEVG